MPRDDVQTPPRNEEQGLGIPRWIGSLPDEEGAILAFALHKSGFGINEGAFREVWHRFIRLRAAVSARVIKRTLERELDEFSDVIERTVRR